ncbi:MULTISPECIES: ABC transporter permease [Micrococcaceae]|uniref:Dipeptide transport system permease protein DppC (TC 3.A.1.5.2) n=1 Tax=Arthrobacter rhombi TaxID=71253 RepID=A0A1R4FKK0_9MICC|nr:MULTISPECIES: ABC transporter permease [Micrococcaceae]PCC25279.1 ABC transporter permease [Glutamicibacter sp. BW78]SJM56409.1 Dipeptide transport system permease protein DppC (TC 3.A.1.5.2) [Arthrobacter rhombi]
MPENTENRPTVRGAKISKYPIEHYVADPDETPLQATDSSVSDAAPVSLWLEAWRNLRTQPLFIISAILIISVVFVALFPGLFTNEQPNANCQLANSDGGAVPGHPLGFTQQGCDILARVMYGTQSSLTIGLFATIAIVIFGGTVGAISGFFGGWVDAVLARLGDIFFALPLILGAIVVVQIPFFQENRNVWTIVLILSAFGWPQIARITRAAVIEVREADFVIAARSLGVSRTGALIRHVIPNSLAPVIVIATITLGIFIVAESTLSYLGIGLPPDVMSWGNDIFSAKSSLRSNPMALFWPALALSLTVLSFIMLGDALQDALDPKARKR